jgi:hypothetical protein
VLADQAGDVTAHVPPARCLGVTREPAIAHQQVFVAQIRGQLSAALQREGDSHRRPPCSLAARQREPGMRLLDYLDPAGELIADESLDELGMI